MARAAVPWGVSTAIVTTAMKRALEHEELLYERSVSLVAT